jgi:N-formylglutamate amidohydrolase
MPHEAIEMHARPNQTKPDIVLGDRFGAAAAREVVDQIEAIFSSEGFRVARNAPFAGAYIAQHYGQPQSRRHVVQVEIDRSLYLDEARVEPSSRFAAMSVHMNRVVGQIAQIGRRAVPMAAE